MAHHDIVMPPRSIRDLEPPIEAADVAGIDESFALVQIPAAVSDAEHRLVAEALAPWPNLRLRVYTFRDDIPDLEWLRAYPTLRRFQIDAYHLRDLTGLRHLPEDTLDIGIGRTKRRLSLAPLDRFRSLRNLWLEGHSKDIEIVSRLTMLTELSLRSITLPDLALFTPLDDLRLLEIKLGGITDLGMLGEIGKVQYLELWMIRGLSDLTGVGRMRSLRHLHLESQKQVERLPDFSNTRLDYALIQNCKGLTDLEPLLTATRLRNVEIVEMPQLRPEHVEVLNRHPSLEGATVSTGSKRWNDAIEKVLTLPEARRPSWYERGGGQDS